MIQGEFFQIQDYEQQKPYLLDYVEKKTNQILSKSKAARLVIEPYDRPASKEARGLYFGVWIPQIARELNAKNQTVKVQNDKGEITETIKFNKKYVHLLLKDRILGEKKVTMGKKLVTVPPSISGYSSNKMCDYMRRVEEYAYERLGIILETDQENEYEVWRRKQNA